MRSARFPHSAQGWQLILADLSLILFLVTLTALVTSSSDEEAADEQANRGKSDVKDTPNVAPYVAPYVAPAQALFRQVEGGPDLGEWLSEQPLDPRATLTILARTSAGDEDAIWQEAQGLANDAQKSGVAVRVVIAGGDKSEVYASLAYDSVFENADPNVSGAILTRQ